MKLFTRLFSKRSQPLKSSHPVNCEPLEDRCLMSTLLKINSIIADNRGEVLIGFNQALDTSTITRSSFQMYTAGPDHKISNADDTFVTIHPHYSPTIFRVTLEGNFTANTIYRVKIVGSRLKSAAGGFLDGDFHGTFPSGNGVAGGNFEFQTSVATGAYSYVRMSTTYGVITLQMLAGKKPLSVANFLAYANSGEYDNIVVTRDPKSPTNFIIQMGSLQINPSNVLIAPPPGNTIHNEFLTNGIVHNTRGTVAFALSGSDQNSATNQFFFNTTDNSANLDNQTGGFTVFARVANTASLDVMDKIDALDTVALHNPTNGHGVAGPFGGTDISDVPINDTSVFGGNISEEFIGQDGQGNPIFQFVPTANFNPSRDLVVIRRTAVQMNVGPLVIPK